MDDHFRLGSAHSGGQLLLVERVGDHSGGATLLEPHGFFRRTRERDHLVSVFQELWQEESAECSSTTRHKDFHGDLALLCCTPGRSLDLLPLVINLGHGAEVREELSNTLLPELLQRLLPQRFLLSLERR